MNIRKLIGRSLKEKAGHHETREEIGEWAYSMYIKHIMEVDDDLEDILLTLTMMELGEGFYYTYEELDKIADDLIAEKDVKL